jgi:hypothetical protein
MHARTCFGLQLAWQSWTAQISCLMEISKMSPVTLLIPGPEKIDTWFMLCYFYASKSLNTHMNIYTIKITGTWKETDHPSLGTAAGRFAHCLSRMPWRHHHWDVELSGMGSSKEQFPCLPLYALTIVQSCTCIIKHVVHLKSDSQVNWIPVCTETPTDLSSSVNPLSNKQVTLNIIL